MKLARIYSSLTFKLEGNSIKIKMGFNQLTVLVGSIFLVLTCVQGSSSGWDSDSSGWSPSLIQVAPIAGVAPLAPVAGLSDTPGIAPVAPIAQPVNSAPSPPHAPPQPNPGPVPQPPNAPNPGWAPPAPPPPQPESGWGSGW